MIKNLNNLPNLQSYAFDTYYKKIIERFDDYLHSINHRHYALNDIPEIKLVEYLSKRNKYIGALWRQLFRISPFNLRSFFGENSINVDSKSQILFALAYLQLYDCYREQEYKKMAETFLQNIIALKSGETSNFAVKQGRLLRVKKYQATYETVAPLLTAFAGNAFLEAYKIFKVEKYLYLATSSAKYFIEEHPKDIENGYVYFYYDHTLKDKIYNASVVISSFLYALGQFKNDKEYIQYGRSGMQILEIAQNADGSWFYGEKKYGKYVDNFHTAFLLTALLDSTVLNGNNILKKVFDKGVEFYKSTLFKRIDENSIQPLHFYTKYLPTNSTIIQKVDIRDCANSIIFFSKLAIIDKENLNSAYKILNWTLRNMQHNTYFITEITWFWKNKIPYVVQQAWMLYALATFCNYKKGLESKNENFTNI
jgi:hypothetical protein